MTVKLPDSPSKLRFVPIPRLAAGGRWRVEAMRSLSEPLLLWFTRGQGRVTVAGTTRGYGPNNAVFIPAGIMHGFEVSQQVYGTAIFFGRSNSVTLPEGPHHLRIRDAATQMEVNAIIDAVQREMDSDRPAHDRASRHHMGLLGVWLERQVALSGAETLRPDAARKLAARYSALLERDFRTGKSVADYATVLGVTPTHLSRVCNQACGRPASVLLQERVLFEARKLLAETRAPVKSIAESLGFRSPAYFTRAFLHRTGQTPTAFRRSA